MKFYSSYNRPPSKAHLICPTEKQDYIRDEATGELVPSGKIPFYERIQSFHDSSTLSFKLKRFAMGDATALGSSNNNFGDFTNMPSDLREVLDTRKKVIQGFSDLSEDIRGIFNNSFDDFEAAVKDGTAERRIYDYTRTKSTAQPQAGASSSANPGGTE